MLWDSYHTQHTTKLSRLAVRVVPRRPSAAAVCYDDDGSHHQGRISAAADCWLTYTQARWVQRRKREFRERKGWHSTQIGHDVISTNHNEKTKDQHFCVLFTRTIATFAPPLCNSFWNTACVVWCLLQGKARRDREWRQNWECAGTAGPQTTCLQINTQLIINGFITSDSQRMTLQNGYHNKNKIMQIDDWIINYGQGGISNWQLTIPYRKDKEGTKEMCLNS